MHSLTHLMKGRSQISAISLRNLAVAHLNRVSASSEANAPLLQPKLLTEVPAAGNLHPMAQPLPLGAEAKADSSSERGESGWRYRTL